MEDKRWDRGLVAVAECSGRAGILLKLRQRGDQHDVELSPASYNGFHMRPPLVIGHLPAPRDTGLHVDEEWQANEVERCGQRAVPVSQSQPGQGLIVVFLGSPSPPCTSSWPDAGIMAALSWYIALGYRSCRCLQTEVAVDVRWIL